MATSAELAAARYGQVQSITAGVVQAVQAIWVGLSPEMILTQLAGEAGQRILSAVISGQLTAAAGAQAFVAGAMLAQGVGSAVAAQVVPSALAGIASDGRPLATLLQLPAIRTAQALAAGMSPDAAMASGLWQMATMVATQINDSARVATSVAMTAERNCVSYVRVVKLPACSRCIILAGRQYSFSEGFKRHPRCDCGMEPMSDAEWRKGQGPGDLYREMSPEERVKRFGAAAVQAMDAGADMGQVVNARRGMVTTATGKQVTTEGTTKRAIGAQAINKATGAGFAAGPGSKIQRVREARLMPEQILNQSRGDRDLALALLRKHGYIT